MQNESSAAKRTGSLWVCIHLKCSVALLEAAGRFSLLQALLSTGLSHQAPSIGRNSWATPQLSTAEAYTGCFWPRLKTWILTKQEIWVPAYPGDSSRIRRFMLVPFALGRQMAVSQPSFVKDCFSKICYLPRHCPVCKLTKNYFLCKKCYPLTS